MKFVSRAAVMPLTAVTCDNSPNTVCCQLMGGGSEQWSIFFLGHTTFLTFDIALLYEPVWLPQAKPCLW